MTTPSRAPGDGAAVSADQALDMLEAQAAHQAGPAVVQSPSHAFDQDVSHESLGMTGDSPVAFVVGNGVRLDVEALTPAQLARYRDILHTRD